MKEYKLFDAEHKFMNIIWEAEPVNSTELSKLCLDILGWKKSTTYNMIRKLAERGFLKNQSAIVTTLVKKSKVKKYEGEALVQKMFDGSLPNFITTFLKEKKLTKTEAEEIKKIIEEATK